MSRNHPTPARPLTAVLMLASPAILAYWAGAAVAQEAETGDETVLAPIAVTASEVAPGGVQLFEDDLDRANAASIKDIFRNEASVNVSGGSDVSRKIYVNGVEDTNLNVKIDGARQVNSAFHHLGTAIIDPGLMKSVRVETGVGPVDVGPGALGGSIAYETKDARDILDIDQRFGGYAKLQYGSNGNQHNEVLTLAGQHENIEGLAYISMDGGNLYEDGNGVETDGTKPDMNHGLAKLAWNSRNGGRVELQGNYLKDEAVRPNRANFGALVNGSPPTLQRFHRKTFNLSYKDEAPTDMVNPEIVLSFNQSDMFIDDLQFGPFQFDMRSETTSYNGKFANTFATGLGLADSGTLTTGVDFYRDRGSNDNSGGFGGNVPLANTETAYNVGAFAQSRLNLSPKWRLSTGLRYDQLWFEGIDGTDIISGGPSGSLNMEYDIRSWLTTYAGGASVYGGIPLGESLIYNFASQWDYTDLSSSRSQSYKAGFKGEEGPFSADIHAYYTEILGSHDRGNVVRNFTRDITSRGFNISGRYGTDAGHLRATFGDNKLRSDGAPLTSGAASFHGLQMGRTMTVEAVRDLHDWGLSLGANAEYAFTDDTVADTPNKSYLVTNIFAQWNPETVDSLTLRLDVKNLLDETYVDRATSGVDNAQVIPFNEPGRSFLVTAKMDF